MPKLPRVPAEKKLNDRQERFALEYVKDFDRARAYRAAGYTSTDEATIATESARLLRNPHVYAVVLREKARIANAMGWSAERTLMYLQFVFSEAVKDKDYSAAVSALDKIAKHYGLYLEHNKQKNYSPEDVERLKGELTAAGFDFSRFHFPGKN